MIKGIGSERFDREHKHFGGKIYPSDFNTDYRGDDNTKGSTIARRIEIDFRWERSLLRQYANTNRFRKTNGGMSNGKAETEL